MVGGSTQGIGKATAFELASLGSHVTLIARNENDLKKVVEELNNQYPADHDYIVADFSQPQLVKGLVQNHIEHHQPFDILINNTGGPPGGPIIEADFDSFLKAMDLHLHCNHLLVQSVLPHMKATGFGRIVNVISTSVKIPIKGLGVSNTTRGAVANWAKTLSMEISQYGITINNVLPGFTKTARLDAIIDNKAQKLGVGRDQVIKEMVDEVPLGRFGESEEVAALAAFLSTPAAGYINGVSIPVDGGRTGSL